MRPLLALLLLAPLVAGAPVPKKVKAKLPDYYPLADGTEWVYAMGQTELTVKVTDVTEKDGVRGLLPDGGCDGSGQRPVI